MIYDESELIDAVREKNIENFNENGGINMYIYKISENELSDSASKKNSVLEKIKEINAKYSTEEFVPAEKTTLGLEEMEFVAPSSDDIKAQAAESLRSDRVSDREAINQKYSTKFVDLKDKAVAALENREEDVAAVESKHDAALKSAENSSIKQGISRSSIYDQVVKSIEGSRESGLNMVEQEYQKAISKLENEKSILEQQKESALTSFDISYAVKLENKIASLNKEIAKQQEAVVKYNNQIAEKEAAHQLAQEKAQTAEQERIWKKNKELLDLINKKGLTEVNKLKAQEKYDVVYNYLSQLSKAEALSELQNDRSYENELGSFYTLLYANMLNRKD